jgi:polygalacturonase
VPNDFTPRRKFIQNLTVGAASVPVASALTMPLTKQLIAAPGELAAAAEAAPAQGAKYVFEVTEFGATPDGRTLCTSAIQSAIDACAKAGGGKVVVPPGRFLTGPLFLKSNLEFEIVAGATLLGSTNFSDYRTIQGRWEGLDRKIFASLLTGDGIENVTITGNGTLDGQGSVWWDAHRKTMALRQAKGLIGREPENPPGSPLPWPRPRMINLYRSKNVRISGLSIVNSPSWNVHPVLCEKVCIDGLTIINPVTSPNTDGIDPESCRNVIISNCYISTGDDCIVIKSGYKYQKENPYTVCENIVITNCVFGKGHGGVAIGSETAGGVRNLVASNCVCDGTTRGLYIKTARGRGSVIEDVRADNWTMRNLSEAAIAVSLIYEPTDADDAMPVDETTPTVRNIHFSRVTATNVPHAIVIQGLPESPIQNLTLSDVAVNSSGFGATCARVRGMAFDSILVNPDAGPAMSLFDVQDLKLHRFRTNKANPGQPAIRMENVQDAFVESCAAAGTSVLVEVKGTENKGVTLELNRIPSGGKEVDFVDGASDAAVIRRG